VAGQLLKLKPAISCKAFSRVPSSILLPFIIPTVLATFVRLEVDVRSDIQRSFSLAPLTISRRLITRSRIIGWGIQNPSAMDLDHQSSHLRGVPFFSPSACSPA